MISAQKLFSDHTAHVALYELLKSAIEELELYRNQCLLDEGREIEALSLSRMPLTDLPRMRSGKSPTERIADRLIAIQDGRDIAEKKRQLATVIQYLHLYDTIITVFTEREKWFVEEFFVQKKTMTVLINSPDSPFFGYDRSSVWRFKKRLLEKADSILGFVYTKGAEM